MKTLVRRIAGKLDKTTGLEKSVSKPPENNKRNEGEQEVTSKTETIITEAPLEQKDFLSPSEDGSEETFAMTSCICPSSHGTMKTESFAKLEEGFSNNVKFCTSANELVPYENKEVIPVASVCSCYPSEMDEERNAVPDDFPVRLVIRSETQGLSKDANLKQRIHTRMKLFKFEEK